MLLLTSCHAFTWENAVNAYQNCAIRGIKDCILVKSCFTSIRLISNICVVEYESQYVRDAMSRSFHPYRPKTMASYRRQFHTFLCYSIRNGVRTVLSVSNLLGFLEFLLACNLSPRAISNYVSAIKSYITLYQLPTDWLSNTMIANYLRAIHIQIPHVNKPRSVLTLKDMQSISILLQKFDNPLVYRSAFLLSYLFYGFLRISNLVSATQSGFDIHRQLCRRDVVFMQDSVMLHLRWAKNLQKSDQSHVVYLPVMKNPYLCPYKTLCELFASQPYGEYDPVIKIGNAYVIEAHLRDLTWC